MRRSWPAAFRSGVTGKGVEEVSGGGGFEGARIDSKRCRCQVPEERRVFGSGSGEGVGGECESLGIHYVRREEANGG